MKYYAELKRWIGQSKYGLRVQGIRKDHGKYDDPLAAPMRVQDYLVMDGFGRSEPLRSEEDVMDALKRGDLLSVRKRGLGYVISFEVPDPPKPKPQPVIDISFDESYVVSATEPDNNGDSDFHIYFKVEKWRKGWWWAACCNYPSIVMDLVSADGPYATELEAFLAARSFAVDSLIANELVVDMPLVELGE